MYGSGVVSEFVSNEQASAVPCRSLTLKIPRSGGNSSVGFELFEGMSVKLEALRAMLSLNTVRTAS